MHSCLPSVQITALTHDYKRGNGSFNLDTDGVPFIIDNSATGAICRERSLFVGPFQQINLSVGTAHGIKSSTKHKGTLRLVLTDDDGNDHSYDVPDVVYDPDSPYSLLGIPFLAAYFAKHNGSEDRFDGGTWIKSAHSQFVWDGEKQ